MWAKSRKPEAKREVGAQRLLLILYFITDKDMERDERKAKRSIYILLHPDPQTPLHWQMEPVFIFQETSSIFLQYQPCRPDPYLIMATNPKDS